MKKSELFYGKSIEEAKAKAVESFGVEEEKITFTVIENAKIGIFGRVKSEAKVQADYEEAEIPKPVAEPEPKISMDDVLKDFDELQTEKDVPAEKVDMCKTFLEKVLSKMKIECNIDIKTENGGIFVNIDSKGSGAVIGRRGETLDALQYICSLVVNRTEGDYVRITIDSCGYRAKRTVTLKALAEKISSRVLRTGSSTILEPMNPYERRIIHSTVAKIYGVNSKSVGDEPYRKVIIASDNPKKHERNRKGGKGKGGSKPHHEPRSLDLKTSFEKDYKKPKPEDDINAGLYGKIEL